MTFYICSGRDWPVLGTPKQHGPPKKCWKISVRFYVAIVWICKFAQWPILVACLEDVSEQQDSAIAP